MCRYDDLKELKLWEELKLRYQEEIEMGNELLQNKFLVEHAELQIDTLKKKLDLNKQDELYRTTPSYNMACQVFEKQNADWKPDSEKSQEFRNVCKSNFITGYLAAKNEEGVSMELYQSLHDKVIKSYDKARELQPKIMLYLKNNYLVELSYHTSDDVITTNIVRRDKKFIVNMEKEIIDDFGEEYNASLYQVVNETIKEFKQEMINKIKN